jgi:phosphoglycerate kinase
MELITIDQLPIAGKRVFIRVDFNVPLNQNREITDDTRIREALPTIRLAMEKNARVLLASHLGRPKGKADPTLSLKPVARHLSGLLGREVGMTPDCIGPGVQSLVENLAPGSVLLLENLRFHAEEEKNQAGFAKALAASAEVYINEAFGSSHRAHASVVGMVSHFSAKGIGFLMRKEIDALSQLLRSPDKPFVAILGGAKVSDKIGLIRNLLPRVDMLVIGGAMAYTLLQAQGVQTGKSLVETEKIEEVKAILQEAEQRRVSLLLPQDHVVTAELKGETSFPTLGKGIPADLMGVDIGPKSVQAFSEAVSQARTIFWNGPMGVFEVPPFDRGTRAIAEAVARSQSFSVAGGGDTVAALTQAGLADQISHISTGGGASLEFLEAGDLPGLAALRL